MNLRVVRVAAIALGAGISACQGPEASGPAEVPAPVPAHLAVLDGNNQQADPQDSLPQPVRFLITTADGKPVPHAAVTFEVPLGGGYVPAQAAVADSTGVASTAWFMGPGGGVQTLEAHAGTTLVATANATTCDPSECYPSERLSGTLGTASLLTLATYEASGQAVHPDVVRGHGSATGFWLAITPYPAGNSAFENPSIFRSSDANNWTAPKGVSNPVALPDATGYLSDPDMVVNTDNHLWMYYRSVLKGSNIVMLTRSSDGAHWDKPVTVLTVPNHMAVSPTVVRGAPHAAWQMWSVNSGTAGCSAASTTLERRTSTDGLTWSAPTTVALVQPGQLVWHVDVQWIPARHEYWALYNTYPAGSSCATNALYIARSADGVTWTTSPSPIARAGVIDAFADIIYRSTFLTNPAGTQVTLWMSGAHLLPNVGYDWRTATVAVSTSDLFAIANAPASTALQDPRDRRSLPPPEPDR